METQKHVGVLHNTQDSKHLLTKLPKLITTHKNRNSDESQGRREEVEYCALFMLTKLFFELSISNSIKQ